MTDKDIKDYCKNCDVEPPAMRFKCPECEHNTDNENIFAKDINVPHKNKKIIELTLTEIKEIAESFCKACQEFEPEKKGSNCMYCNYGIILRKISEVEKWQIKNR